MVHLTHQTAIFSPSVARAAASTAKDWSYMDGWLKTKYQGRSVPPFERNADTLKALLAMASHNEAADDERDQLARIEAAALEEARSADTDNARPADPSDAQGRLDGGQVGDDILAAVESVLTKEGMTALDSIASMAVELGMVDPTPEVLGCKFVELQGKAVELDQTVERVALLQRYLDREAATVGHFIEELQGEEYVPPSDLAKQNLELQRQIKTMSAKLPELRQQIASLEQSVSLSGLTVEDVKEDEAEYLQLLAKKKDLDAQVKAFVGLPPDLDAARAELEALRSELRQTTQRRDAEFEGLVERESPFKPRRRH
jgi:HAUS augmin-like complex subunit 1